jgi:hypothetical protein
MKELRIEVLKVQCRFAFAFDPGEEGCRPMRWSKELCESETDLQTADRSS